MAFNQEQIDTWLRSLQLLINGVHLALIIKSHGHLMNKFLPRSIVFVAFLNVTLLFITAIFIWQWTNYILDLFSFSGEKKCFNFLIVFCCCFAHWWFTLFFQISMPFLYTICKYFFFVASFVRYFHYYFLYSFWWGKTDTILFEPMMKWTHKSFAMKSDKISYKTIVVVISWFSFHSL